MTAAAGAEVEKATGERQVTKKAAASGSKASGSTAAGAPRPAAGAKLADGKAAVQARTSARADAVKKQPPAKEPAAAKTASAAKTPTPAREPAAAKEPAPAKTQPATKVTAGKQPPAAKQPTAAKTPAPAKQPAVAKAPATKQPAGKPAAKRSAAERETTPVQPRGPAAGQSGPGPRPAGTGLLSRRHRAPERRTEGYADERWLNHQRHLLETERETHVEQAQALREEAEALVEEMEPGDIQFDDESGEGGTTTVDRERDLALSAQALQAVDEIDHALAKMASKTYGLCENCGRLIPKPRLEALPFARLCIDCKSGGLSRR